MQDQDGQNNNILEHVMNFNGLGINAGSNKGQVLIKTLQFFQHLCETIIRSLIGKVRK